MNSHAINGLNRSGVAEDTHTKSVKANVRGSGYLTDKDNITLFYSHGHTDVKIEGIPIYFCVFSIDNMYSRS